MLPVVIGGQRVSDTLLPVPARAAVPCTPDAHPQL